MIDLARLDRALKAAGGWWLVVGCRWQVAGVWVVGGVGMGGLRLRRGGEFGSSCGKIEVPTLRNLRSQQRTCPIVSPTSLCVVPSSMASSACARKL